MAAEEGRTWRDFVPAYLPPPPPRLITRAALLADLASAGISERTLRHWERVGALPRAVRQWHEGAVQGVYPYWFKRLALDVRERRRRGDNLATIADAMPGAVTFHAVFAWAEENNTYPLATYLPPLLPQLQLLAALVAQREGRAVEHGVITMYDAQGIPVITLPWEVAGAQLSDGGTEGGASDSVSDGP